MLISPRFYFRDWRISFTLAAAGLANIFTWWYLGTNIAPSGQVFLHYTVIFGVDLVGEWGRIFWLSGSGAAVIIVNSVLAYLVYPSARELSRLLAYVSLLVQALLLLVAFFLVQVNR
ncbi:MAG: hypothetical protein HYV42_04730 [Candidatus Magasanikbacteria bacterium]|nr:hypothetical protein [Candidatus Magasanikbacteria bacterium]